MQHPFDVHIIYDDPLFRRLLDKHFQHAGCKTHVYPDALKAQAALSSRNLVCLVILDWQMPGLQCLEFCKRLKEEGSLLCQHIIMVTTPLSATETLEAFNAGIDDILFKPVSRTILIGRMIAAERLIVKALELQVERNYWEIYAQDLEKVAQERAKQLADSERMATLGILSAGIAHEINNPTSFISGNVQILERTMPMLKRALLLYTESHEEDCHKARFLHEKLPSIIEGMRIGVSRVVRIVNNLKTYVHPGSDSWERVSVKDLVEIALGITAGQYEGRAAVILNIAQDLPDIWGDMVKLEQVLINLIVNGLQAMEHCDIRELSIHSWRDRDDVVISVADTGVGIPPDKLDRIWTPFYTTKRIGQGTGLGLHICKNIIAEHCGSIHASNREEGGTEFRITLPIHTKAQRVQP